MIKVSSFHKDWKRWAKGLWNCVDSLRNYSGNQCYLQNESEEDKWKSEKERIKQKKEYPKDGT